MQAVGGLVTVVIAVALVTLTARARRATAAAGLPRGQRLRPLTLLLIEPLLYVVLAGALLWDELSQSAAHVAAATAGAVVGAALGLYRARIMWVRADPPRRAVILRRSGAEMAAVLVLAVLEVGRSGLEDDADRLDSPLSLLLTALVAFALAEGIMRVVATLGRYRRESAAASSTDATGRPFSR
jgi:hypothetical protein